MDPLWVAILSAIGVSLLVLGSLIRRRSFNRMESRRRELLRRDEQGRIGWLLLWLIGVPIPVLLVLYLLRGCT
jgi:hypothetical protein